MSGKESRPMRHDDDAAAPRLNAVVERWLADEATGDDRAAEGALRSVFRALPTPAPSPGFAARVAARVAPRRRAVPPSLLSAAAVAIALSLPLRVAVALGAFWQLETGTLARLGVDALTALTDAVDKLAAVLRVVAELGSPLRSLLGSPPVLGTLGALVLLMVIGMHRIDGPRLVGRNG